MTNPEQDPKLWEKFATGTRAYKIIDFPRYDDTGKSIGKICIRTLLQKELTDIDLAVCEEVDYLFRTDSKLWDQSSSIMVQRYNERKANITANHYLQKVIVHPEKKDKLIYPTPDHVAKGLSLSEASHLLVQYYQLQEGRPNLSNISVHQFNQWVDLLTKSLKADQVSFLERLEPETQIEFTTYLVSLLSDSNQLNSSLLKQLTEYTKSGSQDSSPPTTE